MQRLRQQDASRSFRTQWWEMAAEQEERGPPSSYDPDHTAESDDKAEQMLNLAAKEGYEPVQKSKVEPMTLKALYRERVEAGLDMPSDLFHLFVKDETKLSQK